MAAKAIAMAPAAPNAPSAGAAPLKSVGTGGEADLVGMTLPLPIGAEAERVILVEDGLNVVRVEFWLAIT